MHKHLPPGEEPIYVTAGSGALTPSPAVFRKVLECGYGNGN